MSGDRVGDEALGAAWLLLPAPFFGVSTWDRVARVLEVIGLSASVVGPEPITTNTEDFLAPWLDEVVKTAAPLQGLTLRLAGHSAVCPRLRLAASALAEQGHDVDTIVYVEGRLPCHNISPAVADPQRIAIMDSVVHPDGYLPPWWAWWGPLVDDVVPDEELRHRVWTDCRRVPRALFDQPVPAPAVASGVVEAFLGFGSGYAPSLDVARAKGWPTAWLEGSHIHQVNDPVTVATTLLHLAAERRLGATDDER